MLAGATKVSTKLTQLRTKLTQLLPLCYRLHDCATGLCDSDPCWESPAFHPGCCIQHACSTLQKITFLNMFPQTYVAVVCCVRRGYRRVHEPAWRLGAAGWQEQPPATAGALQGHLGSRGPQRGLRTAASVPVSAHMLMRRCSMLAGHWVNDYCGVVLPGQCMDSMSRLSMTTRS
jgi:hypothetical protein